MKLYDKLCSPAKFYLVLSLVSYILILLQNIGNKKEFTLGIYSCRHSSPAALLIFQLVYILFWTWVIHLICKINTNISWAIVLFPFVLFFLILALVIIDGIHKDKEGFFDRADLPNASF